MKRINYRYAVEKQSAENIPNIFNIPEIHLQNGKNKPHAYNKNKQYRHRYKEQQRVSVYRKFIAAVYSRNFKENPNANIAYNGYCKSYEI